MVLGIGLYLKSVHSNVHLPVKKKIIHFFFIEILFAVETKTRRRMEGDQFVDI